MAVGRRDREKRMKWGEGGRRSWKGCLQKQEIVGDAQFWGGNDRSAGHCRGVLVYDCIAVF